MREKVGDVASAILLLVFAVAMFGLTFSFPPPGQLNDPGTAALPRIVAGSLGDVESLPRGRAALRVSGILVLASAYAATLEPLGFMLASTLFLLGAMLLAGARKLLYLVLVPSGLSLVLFYVFYRLLEVSLPRGLIEGVLF
jgi:putative tricarboxylic transport membrane protein